MTLRRLHRWNAWFLAAFIIAHMGNHLAILGGIEAHLGVMQVLRVVYRLPGVEHLLIAGFAVQIGLGVRLLIRSRRRDPWGRLQWWSGLVLAVFLTQHIVAAILTRVVYPNVDTNSYWAATVVQGTPHVWYFAPYYVLGIASLFAHLATYVRRSPIAILLALAGPVVGVVIVAGLMGAFGAVSLPQAHQQYLDSYWLD